MAEEAEKVKFYPSWLRFMYVVNIFVNGALDLAFMIAPAQMLSFLGAPAGEPMLAGYTYSILVAFAILSIAASRSWLKFSAVLLTQLSVKVIWFLGIVIPKVAMGDLPSYATFLIITFILYIIGDLIVIPGRYFIAK